MVVRVARSWMIPLIVLVSLVVPYQAAAAKPKKPTTIVALTFDDGDKTHVTAAGLLAKRGLHGTFYINSARVGDSEHMTLKQIKKIAAAGNEIGGHTLDHPHLTMLGPEELYAEICDDRAQLMRWGFKIRTFAYPFGELNESVRFVVRECGYSAARGIGGLSDRVCKSPACRYAEPMRPEMVYDIRTPGSVRAETTLGQLKQQVERAESSGAGLLPLVFHHVCATDCPDAFSVSPAILGQFLDWLAKRAKHGTVVRTLGEVVGGKVRPAPVDDQR
ncbi:polysaccharide deacetylase family protein [Streptosporangiaceae bacterium NEAU-GS5]|nr:polysaccharide deacetylase family protein [Streptosporangiaceae bacterium NEAU-GS5]